MYYKKTCYKLVSYLLWQKYLFYVGSLLMYLHSRSALMNKLQMGLSNIMLLSSIVWELMCHGEVLK